MRSCRRAATTNRDRLQRAAADGLVSFYRQQALYGAALFNPRQQYTLGWLILRRRAAGENRPPL
jgi:hypothetical protein